jgi:hypothetical protein
LITSFFFDFGKNIFSKKFKRILRGYAKAAPTIIGITAERRLSSKPDA